MAAALQIWSATYARAFDDLPATVRAAIERRVNEMGAQLASFPHKRLTGRPEFKLRVGDYRVLYEFDLAAGKIFSTTSATEKRSTRQANASRRFAEKSAILRVEFAA